MRARVGGAVRGASLRALVAVVAALATVLSLSGVAYAAFTAQGNGTGTATAATLNPATAVTGSQTTGTSDVHVSWTAPAGSVSPTGYYVLRTPSPSGPTVAACGTSAAAPTVGTSCTDSSVAVGDYTYSVVAVFRTWTSTAATGTVVHVAATTQAITFTSTASNPTVGGTYTVSATGGASGNPVTFTSATPATCTISGSTVALAHAGTCTINANQAGNAQYDPAPQVQQTLTIAKAAQTPVFTSSAPLFAAVGGSGYTPTATGGASGNPVVLSVDASTATHCSMLAGTVSHQHVGSCTVDATQAGNADYLPGLTQQSYAIGQGSQAITFTSTAPSAAQVNGATYAVTATGGGSGNAVTFTSATASACTVSGSTVSFVAAGTCTVNANQAGNADYLAATQVQQTFTVSRADQTITFTSTAPSSATYQGATYAVTATSTSGLAVALTVDGSSTSVCSLSGSTVSFIGAGTCTIDANQAGNATFNPAGQVQQAFAVGRASQTITFGPLGGKTYGNAPFTISATASSGLTVAFASATTGVCTVSGTTVTIVGGGTCTINADQAGNGNYAVANRVQQSFTVAKANQTITFTQPTTPATAATTATLVFSSDSGLAVTMTPTDATVCTVSGTTVTYLKSGSCVLTASQAGDGNYNAATSVPRTVAVNKANQTITFTQPATPANSGTTAPLVATSTSGLVVTFTTTSAATICTISGTTVTYVGAGNCVINASQAGDATYNAATPVPRTVVVQAPFVITDRVAGSPQNSTVVRGTGTPGAAVTVFLCTGTQTACTSGSATFVGSRTATVAADGTWAAAEYNKLGNGTFTAQAVQTTPAATSNAFVFTNS